MPIVYEGVIPQDGGGGTLFNGMKFWVSNYVPMRTTCIQNIKSNGGQVVPLEKNADFLLVDHARHNNPPGAHSWKFINDSIQAGALQRIEDYLCTEAPPKPRSVGSSMPQKATRTPFTTQDDLILSKWVTEHEKLGLGISGNAIYQELEKKYPHHTWQSWRSRWKEKLSYLPRPPVSDGEASPPPSPAPPRDTARAATPPRSRARWVAARSPATPGGRNRFTPEEDKILLEYVRQCESDNKATSGNKIYEELAKDFPQHTMHSWRDRYVRHLKPKLESHGGGGGVSEATATKSASRGSRVGNAPRNPSAGDRQKFTREEAPATEDQNTSHAANEGESEDDNEFQEQPLPELSRARAEVSPVRSQEPQEENADDGQPSSAHLPADGLPDEDEDELSPFHEETNLKQQFNSDYQAYAENVESQAHWWPSIRGKTLELWQLWQAVQSQKVEPEERDWQQISETLGFNWVEDESIPDEVRQCYETHLGEFEAFVLNFDNQSDDEDETQANAMLGAPMPSSPPTLPLAKRSYATALGTDHLYPSSSPKRPRYNRDNEVPSTPDEKNGTSHLRRRNIPPRIGTPSSGSPRKGVNLAPYRKSANESDTWRPRSQSPADEQVESQINITPSQQLLTELGARSDGSGVTPTPARSIRDPFVEDPDEPDDSTPRASTSAPTHVLSPSLSASKPKRRPLPKSFNQPQSSRASGSPATRSRQQHLPSSPPIPADDASPAARPQPKPQAPVKETADDIIDFYMSLGYARNVVIRSLDATTWVPGLASQLMEMLKRGESLPTNWRGVWTQKDDETLRAVSADDNGLQDVKEKRKRDKQREKLEKKHTLEGMDMRMRFLEANAMGEVRFAGSEGGRRRA